MNRLLTLMLVSLVPLTRGTSATIDQLLPWLEPNSLSLETSFDDFTKEHPTAKEIFFNDPQPGKPFNGGRVEHLPDGSLFAYGFLDDKLGSVDWASGSRVNMAERVRAVRNELIRVHGQPTVETNARVDSEGSIARIVREVYRPTVEKDYVITLMATSEGVEVALMNEAIQRKHGIKNSRETYEEGVKSISTVVSPSQEPSQLFDYLAAEREKPEAPQPDAKPKLLVEQLPTASTRIAAAKIIGTPVLSVEQRASIWPWIVGISAVLMVVVLVSKRRA